MVMNDEAHFPHLCIEILLFSVCHSHDRSPRALCETVQGAEECSDVLGEVDPPSLVLVLL